MDEARNEAVLKRSKEKLKKEAEQIVTEFFDHVLDISEVAIGDPQRYRPFRSKVLRAGNDAIRKLKKVMDRDYKVLYVPSNEDIVEVVVPSIAPKKQSK